MSNYCPSMDWDRYCDMYDEPEDDCEFDAEIMTDLEIDQFLFNQLLSALGLSNRCYISDNLRYAYQDDVLDFDKYDGLAKLLRIEPMSHQKSLQDKSKSTALLLNCVDITLAVISLCDSLGYYDVSHHNSYSLKAARVFRAIGQYLAKL